MLLQCVVFCSHLQAFHALVEDLVKPFLDGTVHIDLIAGIDAMGFVLGELFFTYKSLSHVAKSMKLVP